jgi:acetolactate synthase-1/2/3 large subunit
MTLWHIDTERSFAADAATALAQVSEVLAGRPRLDASSPAAYWASRHADRAARLRREGETRAALTPEFVTASVRRHAREDAIFLNEGISNYGAIHDHVAPVIPGTLHASGASSLGWHGGAAIGMKLAAPDREVIAFTGDGTFMFSIPSTVHWMARQYRAPFLTIVFNNRGWRSPRLSTLAVYPVGYTSRANSGLDLAFDPPPDYGQIAAAAGGAFARAVKSPEELEPALSDAFRALRDEHRAAVLDVWI